jgi:5-methylcytosine-specific restriction endonuclease McrA
MQRYTENKKIEILEYLKTHTWKDTIKKFKVSNVILNYWQNPKAREKMNYRAKEYIKTPKYKEYRKQFYQENKKRIIAEVGEYCRNHREQRQAQHKKWLKINKKKILEYRRLRKEENQKWRCTWEYYKFAQSIRKRDDYICQHCKANGCKLHAHHIKHAIKYPELRWDENNMITLCEKCHKKEHYNS